MTVACNAADPQTDRDPTLTNMRWPSQNIIAMSDHQQNGCLQIRKLSIVVDISSEETVRESIWEIVKVIFPSWEPSELSVNVLSGGLTNNLYLCEHTTSELKFLCRIYGENTEKFIDREAEIQNMHFLHSNGMGPRVHCAFRNGLCYDYFDGQTADLEMVTGPKYMNQIAELMARMHTIPMLPYHGNEAKIGIMLEHYLSLVPSESMRSVEKSLETEFRGPLNLSHEVESIRKVFEKIECPIVFCHNDLLPKNILLGDDGAHFIDYEYACSNYQAFDIGNFFTEFGGQETYDRSLYPTKQWQLRWIKVYLNEYCHLKGNDPPSEEDIYKLYVEVNKLALSSMLLWGLWALIQAASSTIDADYEGFARVRLGMYFSKKDEFLAL